MSTAVVKLKPVTIMDLVMLGEEPEEISHMTHGMKFVDVVEWLKREAYNGTMTQGGITLLSRPNWPQHGTSDYQVMLGNKQESLRDIALCIVQQFRSLYPKHVIGQPNSIPVPESDYHYTEGVMKKFAKRCLVEVAVAQIDQEIKGLTTRKSALTSVV